MCVPNILLYSFKRFSSGHHSPVPKYLRVATASSLAIRFCGSPITSVDSIIT